MISEEASTLMKRGIEAMNAGSPARLAEAVTCFDDAIELRRQLFTPGDEGAAHLLAASWMNRGDALTQLGGAERLAEALRSYDEALAALRAAPPEREPQYRGQHALAWMNRGLTLQQQATDEALEESIRSFTRAIDTVQGFPEHDLLLAGVSINHAMSLLAVKPPRAAAARKSAELALAQTSETERQSPVAANISLKAQILLCRAVETHLVSKNQEPDETRELLNAATDAVEAGLALARQWEKRGETCLGALPTVLFRFGLDVYRRRQPQFLPEFVRENLQDSVSLEWHRLAAETLSAEVRTFPPDDFTFVNTPRHTLMLETVQALRFVEGRFRGLTQASF